MLKNKNPNANDIEWHANAFPCRSRNSRMRKYKNAVINKHGTDTIMPLCQKMK